MHEIGVQAVLAGVDAGAGAACARRVSSTVQPMWGIFEARVGGADRRHVAGDPAEPEAW